MTDNQDVVLVRERVEHLIGDDHELGALTGGSGHKGHTSYVLDNLEFNTDDLSIVVSYEYTLFVETEFTYEPDNPPYKTKYKKRIVLDRNMKVISESEPEVLWSNLLP